MKNHQRSTEYDRFSYLEKLRLRTMEPPKIQLVAMLNNDAFYLLDSIKSDARMNPKLIENEICIIGRIKA